MYNRLRINVVSEWLVRNNSVIGPLTLTRTAFWIQNDGAIPVFVRMLKNEEAAIAAVHLDTIESCVIDGVLDSPGVPLDMQLDFWKNIVFSSCCVDEYGAGIPSLLGSSGISL